MALRARQWHKHIPGAAGERRGCMYFKCAIAEQCWSRATASCANSGPRWHCLVPLDIGHVLMLDPYSHGIDCTTCTESSVEICIPLNLQQRISLPNPQCARRTKPASTDWGSLLPPHCHTAVPLEKSNSTSNRHTHIASRQPWTPWAPAVSWRWCKRLNKKASADFGHVLSIQEGAHIALRCTCLHSLLSASLQGAAELLEPLPRSSAFAHAEKVSVCHW